MSYKRFVLLVSGLPLSVGLVWLVTTAVAAHQPTNSSLASPRVAASPQAVCNPGLVSIHLRRPVTLPPALPRPAVSPQALSRPGALLLAPRPGAGRTRPGHAVA
jgi:hypothetical protein